MGGNILTLWCKLELMIRMTSPGVVAVEPTSVGRFLKAVTKNRPGTSSRLFPTTVTERHQVRVISRVKHFFSFSFLYFLSSTGARGWALVVGACVDRSHPLPVLAVETPPSLLQGFGMSAKR